MIVVLVRRSLFVVATPSSARASKQLATTVLSSLCMTSELRYAHVSECADGKLGKEQQQVFSRSHANGGASLSAVSGSGGSPWRIHGLAQVVSIPPGATNHSCASPAFRLCIPNLDDVRSQLAIALLARASDRRQEGAWSELHV